MRRHSDPCEICSPLPSAQPCSLSSSARASSTRRRGALAPHLIVPGGLGLHPRLLEMGHERDDALYLAVEVGLPLGRRVEARAVGLQYALEVRGQLVDFAQVMLHASAGFLGGAVGLAGES